MAKGQRLDYVGGIFHVVVRGHNKSFVFEHSEDKAFFMKCLKDAKTIGGVQILYYVVMSNHYHIILRVSEGSMAKAMHCLNLAYARYYNAKYNRSGTVYGRRYSSYHVKDMRYLKKLILYIAHNPVKAGIVKEPIDYYWSAHMELVITNNLDLVDKTALYDLLGDTRIEGLQEYKRLFHHTDKKLQMEFELDIEAFHDLHNQKQMQDLQVWGAKWAGSARAFSHIMCHFGDKNHTAKRHLCMAEALENGFSSTLLAKAFGLSMRRVHQLNGKK